MGEKTHIVQVKSLHQRRRRYAAVFAVCEPAVAVWVVCVCVWQGLVHICIYIYINGNFRILDWRYLPYIRPM